MLGATRHLSLIKADPAAIEANDHARRIRNKETILSVMKEMGIPRIKVTYCGSSDSGSIEGIVPEGHNEPSIDLDKVFVEVETNASRLESGVWVLAGRMQQVPLSEAAKDFVNDWLDSYQLGWETNDGGEGEFVFNLEEGKVLITHNENYLEVYTSEAEV